jgi:hypothetical protein
MLVPSGPSGAEHWLRLVAPFEPARSLILTLWIETKRVLSIHCANCIPRQADMHRAGMNIAPGALYRLRCKNCLPTRRLEQGIDSLHDQSNLDAGEAISPR